MKKLFLLLTLAMGFTSLAQKTANINNEQTLNWIGRAAVGGYAPEGTLDIKSASVEYTSEEIKSLSIIVDMKSLEQENRQLRDHLKEEDFFYVEKYPEATFSLSEPVQVENGKAELKGIMTIRGNTNSETIPATVQLADGQITITFDHKMDRTLYGVNHNSPSIFKRLKENAIADEFVLKGTLVFQNQYQP